jgi:hypothetical protein
MATMTAMGMATMTAKEKCTSNFLSCHVCLVPSTYLDGFLGGVVYFA